MREWSRKYPFRAMFLFTHIFNLVPNNRLGETCCDRAKIVCCGQVWRRLDNKLAADLTKTTRDRSVGTTCWFHHTCCKLLYQTCYILLVTGLHSELFQQVSTALLSTACDRPVPASLLPPDETNIPVATWWQLAARRKINNLRQACEISGCLENIQVFLDMKYRMFGQTASNYTIVLVCVTLWRHLTSR
jgi:hypothetical protein